MLEKIVSIKNVGRFVDYAATGDVTLRRLTLIHAENGRGKTTLSEILRSLRSGDPNPVLAKKTLGDPATGEPELHLRVGGQDAIFGDGTWSRSLAGARIFDSQFVHENVYAGFYVDHEHKKRHYQFVVGERGKVLADRVSDLDGQTRRLSSGINDKDDEIRPHIIGAMTVQQFVDLPAVDHIDDAIAVRRRTCKSLEKAQDIAEKDLLSEVTLPSFSLANVEAVLSRRLDHVAGEAERKTRDHIDGCMDDHGEVWIRQGLGYIDDEKCPFCARPLASVDLIAAYRAFFSDAYDGFRAEITAASQNATQSFSEESLLEVQQTINTNAALADFWRQHVDAGMPEIDFGVVREKWIGLRDALQEQLSRKVRSPLEAVPLGAPLSEPAAAYEEVLATAAACNTAVETVNLSIQHEKEETAAGDLAASRHLLNRLENTKTRHSREMHVKCLEYQALVTEKRIKELKKEQTKRELDDYADVVFAAYQGAISRYLHLLGAGFRIVNVGRRYAGGSASSTYQIEINDTAVDVGDNTTPPEAPCFKTTLSDGDRTTLAFAFFLARLDQDLDLDSRVVVFDDPICSLDGHRRTCTQQQIGRICQRGEQVVVMSHDPHFLRMFWEHADRAETKTLHITRAGDESTIAEWDIETATQAEYFQRYRALAAYLGGDHSGDLLPIAQGIRPLLEGNLRVRFPEDFAPDELLGQFLAKIREAAPGSRLSAMQPLLGELAEVNDFSKKYHHDQNSGWASEPINDGELHTYVGRAFDLIPGVLTTGGPP